jgi:hypothetical protein
MVIETQGRDLDPDHVNRERSRVGTAKDHRMRWDAAALETVIFGQEQFESGLRRPCSRIRDELAKQRLTSCGQWELHLDDRSVAEERPNHAGHQRRPQISCTWP